MPYSPSTSGYEPQTALVLLTPVNIGSCADGLRRRAREGMPFVLSSNLKIDTLCRFGMAATGQQGWWKLGRGALSTNDVIRRRAKALRRTVRQRITLMRLKRSASLPAQWLVPSTSPELYADVRSLAAASPPLRMAISRSTSIPTETPEDPMLR